MELNQIQDMGYEDCDWISQSLSRALHLYSNQSQSVEPLTKANPSPRRLHLHFLNPERAHAGGRPGFSKNLSLAYSNIALKRLDWHPRVNRSYSEVLNTSKFPHFPLPSIPTSF